MAFTAADLAPRIEVVDRDLLGAAVYKGIIEVMPIGSRLVPRVLGISKEHAKEVT